MLKDDKIHPGHIVIFKFKRKKIKSQPDGMGVAKDDKGNVFYIHVWKGATKTGEVFLKGRFITRERFEETKDNLAEINNFDDLPF
jgi:hypothetical protein